MIELRGLTKRYGIQAELKYDYALKALAKMGYQAVGFGARDLRLDILSLVLNSNEAKDVLVSANVGILDFDPESRRMRIKALHPGVTVDEVQSNTGFELLVPRQIETTQPPTATELGVLRRLDPEQRYTRAKED